MNIKIPAWILLLTLATSCMRWDYATEDPDMRLPGNGLFVLNEGNFQYGNSTLTYYNPTDENVQNEVFLRANGMKLGDVAQSMTVAEGRGWIVVNNSHVVFAIDTETGRETGRIVNLTSPRYIHFISPEKAYVSQLWDNRIVVVNPTTYSVTGYIEVPDMSTETGSTEQMVTYGRYVFCTCWSYQNRIIKIDTATDAVVAQLEIGIQPKGLVLDSENTLWTITDGGYEGSPYGFETPALWKIDAETFSVTARFPFRPGDNPRDLCLNGDGTQIMWINDDIWRMDINATALPTEPFLKAKATRYYALTVNPDNGDVYVSDAIDYQQQGVVYRYSKDGTLIDKFTAGVTPGFFCWK